MIMPHLTLDSYQ